MNWTRRPFLTAVESDGMAALSGCSRSRLIEDDRGTSANLDPIVVDGMRGLAEGSGTVDDPYDSIMGD